jgi:hypothetical protein
MILFAGPSLAGVHVSSNKGIDVRPPVRQGDVYLATLERPSAIGIIDGYFEGVPSVWHKEILWAMSHGISVLGASSMGALRAAELGASVLLLTKTPFTETNSAWAKGGVAAVVHDSDSVQLHVEDTLQVGAGIADPEVAYSIISKSSDAIRWLQSLGAEFDRGPDGELQLSMEGGHSVHRVVVVECESMRTLRVGILSLTDLTRAGTNDGRTEEK